MPRQLTYSSSLPSYWTKMHTRDYVFILIQPNLAMICSEVFRWFFYGFYFDDETLICLIGFLDSVWLYLTDPRLLRLCIIYMYYYYLNNNSPLKLSPTNCRFLDNHSETDQFRSKRCSYVLRCIDNVTTSFNTRTSSSSHLHHIFSKLSSTNYQFVINRKHSSELISVFIIIIFKSNSKCLRLTVLLCYCFLVSGFCFFFFSSSSSGVGTDRYCDDAASGDGCRLLIHDEMWYVRFLFGEFSTTERFFFIICFSFYLSPW